MLVVQADGNDVQPVKVDEFRIAVSETYDVIVRPPGDRAYTIFAETMSRSGYARGTLAPRAGMVAEVPALREPPILRSEEHTSELQSLMRISYALFCLKKKRNNHEAS